MHLSMMLVAGLLAASSTGMPGPSVQPSQVLQGNAVLRSDETGRWLVLALDEFDHNGLADGTVDRLFLFALPPGRGVEPRLSQSITSAQIEWDHDALYVVSPRDRRLLQFLLAGAAERHDRSLSSTVYRDGVQLMSRAGAYLGSPRLDSFDVKTSVDLPSLAPSGGVQRGGSGSCASAQSETCAFGSSSTSCASGCAACECGSDGKPSCACQ